MNTQKYYPIEFLHWSAQIEQGIEQIQKILIVNPEYINTVNQNNDNALMIAARVNHHDMINYLLNHTNINYKHSNHEGNFITIAIKNKNIDLAKNILNNFSGLIDFNKNEEINMFNLCMPFVLNNNLSLIECVIEQAENLQELHKFEKLVNELSNNNIKSTLNTIIQMNKLNQGLKSKNKIKTIKI